MLGLVALWPSWLAAAGAAPESCPAIDPPPRPAWNLRVFLDPSTGKRRAPTAEELRALAEERLRRRAESPRVYDVVVYPDGTRYVNLQGAFGFDVIAEKKPGSPAQLRCVPQKPSAPEK